uniref:Uncharacterized protein n=1 Tax=Arundo donax TaxID=35708 RepID=A0A0A9DUT9_ARUDO
MKAGIDTLCIVLCSATPHKPRSILFSTFVRFTLIQITGLYYYYSFVIATKE